MAIITAPIQELLLTYKVRTNLTLGRKFPTIPFPGPSSTVKIFQVLLNAILVLLLFQSFLQD